MVTKYEHEKKDGVSMIFNTLATQASEEKSPFSLVEEFNKLSESEKEKFRKAILNEDFEELEGSKEPEEPKEPEELETDMEGGND